MGDTSIAAVKNQNGNFQPGKKTARENKSQETFDFTMLMNQTVSSQITVNQPSYEDTKVDVAQKTDTEQGVSDSYVNQNKKVRPAEEKKISKDTIDETTEQMDEFASELTEELEETFGVTKEQIEEAMNLLDLKFSDLMDPANLTELVTQLTGVSDTGELLLNNGYIDLMRATQELTQDVLKELGLTMEELQDICEGTMEQENVTDIVQERTGELDGMLEDELKGQDEKNTADVNSALEDQGQNSEVMEDQTIQKGDTQNQDSNRSTDEEGTEEEEIRKNNVETVEEGTTEEDTSFQKDLTLNHSETEENHSEKQPVMSEHVTTTGNTVTTLENSGIARTNVPLPAQQVDVQNIIEQITEFSKTQISRDGTTISMQLNPESLGKIYLQVAYKEGAVTAQLAAQNETVKEAIENQVAQLKENFNQQGIKVDAIEVTVASHEFERNLEENQQQMNQQQEEQSQSQGRRNLNLSEDDIQALFEDLSEEENLNAKIMLDSGNTVDMTA